MDFACVFARSWKSIDFVPIAMPTCVLWHAFQGTHFDLQIRCARLSPNWFCSFVASFFWNRGFFYAFVNVSCLRACMRARMRACKHAFLCACIRVRACEWVYLSVYVFRCVYLHFFLWCVYECVRVCECLCLSICIRIWYRMLIIDCASYGREMSGF